MFSTGPAHRHVLLLIVRSNDEKPPPRGGVTMWMRSFTYRLFIACVVANHCYVIVIISNRCHTHLAVTRARPIKRRLTATAREHDACSSWRSSHTLLRLLDVRVSKALHHHDQVVKGDALAWLTVLDGWSKCVLQQTQHFSACIVPSRPKASVNTSAVTTASLSSLSFRIGLPSQHTRAPTARHIQPALLTTTISRQKGKRCWRGGFRWDICPTCRQHFAVSQG